MREIILGAQGQHVCIVDDEDYEYLIQWKWNFKVNRGGNVYARRSIGRQAVYMHHVILKRAGKIQPSPRHTADHGNRASLDNTRDNLDWRTKRQQNLNRRPFRRRHVTPALEIPTPF